MLGLHWDHDVHDLHDSRKTWSFTNVFAFLRFHTFYYALTTFCYDLERSGQDLLRFSVQISSRSLKFS